MSARRSQVLTPSRIGRIAEPRDPKLKSLWIKVRTGRFDKSILENADRIRSRLKRGGSGFQHNGDELIARSVVWDVDDYHCQFKDAEAMVRKPAEIFLKQWGDGQIAQDPWL